MSAVHLRGLVGVHAGRRLVQQQQDRVAGKRSGDLQAALVTVRQVLGQLVVPALQPDERQQLPAAAPRAASSSRARRGVEIDGGPPGCCAA